ncbi:uncharacterized protein LOC132181835 [Corylus avellana]|uniref:uncharacterized protein LOC132181835 n=1 Tax=Corylus avellana TaxID=13451 RepID=UPI00286C6BE7|nr:uncharacterized protein LOC132181835 [Corylus avellana]
MVDKMANWENGLMAEELMKNTNLPFTDRVINFPLPHKFKMPHIDKYDGNGDPTEHMESLRAHFILHGTPDEISCRAFPLTLVGVAKEWFARLPLKFVDNFKSLGCLFLCQFLATRKRKKNPTYLLSLIQGKDESLKDFTLRFNKEKLTVKNPSEQMILNALMHGAEEYINQEETVGALIKSQEKATRQDGGAAKVAPVSSRKKQEKNPKQQEKKTLKPKNDSQRKLSKFTPLNTSMTEVLMEIKRDPTFRWPTKLKDPLSKRDHTKFCQYHNEVGHLTEECVSLDQEIEAFIKNGRLGKLLAGERNRGRNPQQPLLLEGNREAIRGKGKITI